MRYRLGFLMLAAILHGCAPLSRDECPAVDWYNVGYEDGLSGRAREPVAEQSAACTASDLERYSRGHELGVAQFCQPGNGFTLGVRGGRYEGVCAGILEPEFLQAFEAGREIYGAELQIRRLDEILAVNEAERDRLGAALRRKRGELARDGADAERRRSLAAELQELQATLEMVDNEIDGIRAALDQENRHLLSLRQASPHW